MNLDPRALLAEAQAVRADAKGPVPSPCRNICAIDDRTGLCRGCLRTLNEIAGWGTLPDAGKRAVWRLLEQRAETALNET